MIKELDNVVLTVDLPQHGLTAGDIGSVVMAHTENEGYEVEFMTLDGETLVVTSLVSAQVRPISHKEIAHVRSVAA